MAVIKVPKTPRKSFDPARRPSALLLEQIKHLEWAALPAAQRAPGGDLPLKTVKTEGAAAERIAQLTALVLEQQARPYTPGEAARVVLPPVPGASPARESARATKARPAKARTKAPSRKAAKRHATKATRRRAAKTTKAATPRKRGRRGSKAR